MIPLNWTLTPGLEETDRARVRRLRQINMLRIPIDPIIRLHGGQTHCHGEQGDWHNVHLFCGDFLQRDWVLEACA